MLYVQSFHYDFYHLKVMGLYIIVSFIVFRSNKVCFKFYTSFQNKSLTHQQFLLHQDH